MKIFQKERMLTPSWDLVSPSIDLLKKNIQPILYLSALPQLVVTLGLLLLPSHISFPLTNRDITAFAVTAAGGLWALLMYPGFLLFVSGTAQGKEITIGQAFREGIRRLLPLIGMSIVLGIITAVGFLLLIVPGLICLRAFFLAPYYLVDQKLGPIQALKKSAADSKPVSAWVWGSIGVTIAFSLAASFLGIIPVLGTIASFVITYLYVFGVPLRYTEVAGLQTVKFDQPEE